ncbi:MAG: ribonuclease III domain-containing protein [Cyanobacteriota bacterium]|nr:ribonuclease III domain-containing protein [Cyanobacteriota bacterium]
MEDPKKELWLAGIPTLAVPPAEFRRLPAAALAYLGDAIYELYIRQSYLLPPQRITLYHQQVVQRVRGSTQAETLQALLPHLTPQEASIVRWGENGAGQPPKNLDPDRYRQASGFETLLGYLYLQDPRRLGEVLALADQYFALDTPPNHCRGASPTTVSGEGGANQPDSLGKI